MSDYLNEQAQQFFKVPILLVEPSKTIEVTDHDGELLGILEDMGGDYQVRINGEYAGMIEKSMSEPAAADLYLTANEKQVLTDALTATVGQLDGIMENTPSREVADASNTLMDILDKLKGGK